MSKWLMAVAVLVLVLAGKARGEFINGWTDGNDLQK